MLKEGSQVNWFVVLSTQILNRHILLCLQNIIIALKLAQLFRQSYILELTVIQKARKHVGQRYQVIPSRLREKVKLVETRIEEVAIEVIALLLIKVLPLHVKVWASKSEVNYMYVSISKNASSNQAIRGVISAFAYHDVVKLHVTVDEARTMNFFQGLHQWNAKGAYVLLRQLTLFIFENLLKVPFIFW